MTTENKNPTLGEYVRERRESRGLDFNEAARRSGLDHTFWRKLEAGQYESPHPKSLIPIAKALDSPIEDLYALAGYDAPARLPNFTPYLRARYHLPHEAVVDLERYFDMVRAYYGIPKDRSVFPPKLAAPRTSRSVPRTPKRDRKSS